MYDCFLQMLNTQQHQPPTAAPCRCPLDPAAPGNTFHASLARRVRAQSVETAADRFIVRPRIFLHLIKYSHNVHLPTRCPARP